MTTAYVKGYWKEVEDLTLQELREMLDEVEVDLRALGATEVFVSEVDDVDGTLFIKGVRPYTAEEEEEAKRREAMARDAAVQRAIKLIEESTGKEVKLV